MDVLSKIQYRYDIFLAPSSNPLLSGRYVDRATAESLKLATTSDSPPHIILGADSTSTLSPGGPGRKSVRVQSHKQYGHDTVLVADIYHMPQGCG